MLANFAAAMEAKELTYMYRMRQNKVSPIFANFLAIARNFDVKFYRFIPVYNHVTRRKGISLSVAKKKVIGFFSNHIL